jgi:hypothetical protein
MPPVPERVCCATAVLARHHALRHVRYPLKSGRNPDVRIPREVHGPHLHTAETVAGGPVIADSTRGPIDLG